MDSLLKVGIGTGVVAGAAFGYAQYFRLTGPALATAMKVTCVAGAIAALAAVLWIVSALYTAYRVRSNNPTTTRETNDTADDASTTWNKALDRKETVGPQTTADLTAAPTHNTDARTSEKKPTQTDTHSAINPTEETGPSTPPESLNLRRSLVTPDSLASVSSPTITPPPSLFSTRLKDNTGLGTASTALNERVAEAIAAIHAFPPNSSSGPDLSASIFSLISPSASTEANTQPAIASVVTTTTSSETSASTSASSSAESASNANSAATISGEITASASAISSTATSTVEPEPRSAPPKASAAVVESSSSQPAASTTEDVVRVKIVPDNAEEVAVSISAASTATTTAAASAVSTVEVSDTDEKHSPPPPMAHLELSQTKKPASTTAAVSPTKTFPKKSLTTESFTKGLTKRRKQSGNKKRK